MKTRTPHVPYSNQRSQNRHSSNTTDLQRPKTSPVLSYIKSVAGVFTRFLFRRTKTTSNGALGNAYKNNRQVKGGPFLSDLSTGSDSKSPSKLKSSSRSYGSSSPRSGLMGCFKFSIEEIYEATENFSPQHIIGEGGFGTVYKGRLRDGHFVAIKRAKQDLYEKVSRMEFKNEIATLSKIEHLNLVRLLGYLEHGDERVIVVEFVDNGTLRDHLDGKRGKGLEIAERLEIAIDVAHAITYLHMYTDRPIIHRDIKSSNVLITTKLRAKVADFGFARLGAEDPNATHISTQVKGTSGYMDPEYLRTYQLTEKSDVYSFGVLLVELMTGRLPIEPKRPPKERITIRWAMQRLKEGEFVIAMDPKLRRTPASNMAVEKVLKLARQCLAPSRQSRPSMKNCGEVLWGIRKDYKESSLASYSPSASHHSANFPYRDAKKSRHLAFGIEEGESHEFMSA